MNFIVEVEAGRAQALGSIAFGRHVSFRLVRRSRIRSGACDGSCMEVTGK